MLSSVEAAVVPAPRRLSRVLEMQGWEERRQRCFVSTGGAARCRRAGSAAARAVAERAEPSDALRVDARRLACAIVGAEAWGRGSWRLAGVPRRGVADRLDNLADRGDHEPGLLVVDVV